mgnify:CR=1 FL=1
MGKSNELFNGIDGEGLYDTKTSICEIKALDVINYLNSRRGFIDWWHVIPIELKNNIIDSISKIIERNDDINLAKDTVSDGFGNTWSIKCPACGKDEIFVVRPGKIQCNNCGY